MRLYSGDEGRTQREGKFGPKIGMRAAAKGEQKVLQTARAQS
jgi:hypothetical protein